MRTTLNLDEGLLLEARRAVHVDEKTKLIHLGLQALIQEAARKRLGNLYGSIRKARAPERRNVL